MSAELRRRILTGVLGGVTILALILWGGRVGLAVVTLVVSLGIIYEWGSITLKLRDHEDKLRILAVLSGVSASFQFYAPVDGFVNQAFLFLLLFIYYLCTARQHAPVAENLRSHFSELSLSNFALMYVNILSFCLGRLSHSPEGRHWVIVFLLMVWASDSAAYFVGKSLGQARLYPEISPKKTWSGAVGGLLAACIVPLLAVGVGWWQFRSALWVLILGSICLGVLVQLGDLAESFFKRAFAVKDSGSLLPGHGGFLDRFDGVVFGLPLLYAGFRIWGDLGGFPPY